MNRELKVLLVEDDSVVCRNIIKAVDKTDSVRLIGVTNSVEKAVEYVSDGLPDAIILDIELNKGSGNGVTLMKQLRDLDLAVFPYLLVTTNSAGTETHDTARDMGADFIVCKQQEDYSAENIIDFLSSVNSVILSRKKTDASEDIKERDDRILKRLHTELDLIGVSPKVVGRVYLVDSILIIMEKPEPNFSRRIAAKHGKSVPSVERAMQTAITGAWKNNCAEELAKYYTARISPSKGIPTVTEFIYFYAAKVKNNW
ncbi:MAG: response regulator [Oscillospiraceae bacterium]|jgi:DNA-binding NarL/FixJ family response regulator|nr:response regulator [Oscillospiraceae bacterium]